MCIFIRIRGDIIRSANSEANFIEERRRRTESYGDRDFRFWSGISYYDDYPVDAEFEYKYVHVGSRFYNGTQLINSIPL